MEPLKVHGDTIESLIQERRETEKEALNLQRQIERIRLEKDSAQTDHSEELDEEIDKLTQLQKQKARKLKDICRVVRTISAGD